MKCVLNIRIVQKTTEHLLLAGCDGNTDGERASNKPKVRICHHLVVKTDVTSWIPMTGNSKEED